MARRFAWHARPASWHVASSSSLRFLSQSATVGVQKVIRHRDPPSHGQKGWNQIHHLRMWGEWLYPSAASSQQVRRILLCVTVAILAQGTSWAVADTQAFLASGSIPTSGEISWSDYRRQSDQQCASQRSVRKKIGYTSRFVRVILAQGPC